ncbi:hypothetical protein [Desulfofustis glycolicus]|uniref:Uncharacterized protein n=1 Tax=Desulfofustis glycolicus DSM 9705 TaxID=1121409 RepID=A0A1M5YWX6_9BACT|nr:hypothetical protein [Desulfofustis glycolicus]SHI16536.1 hypothetical protein SAMN02745124_04530 [Desulfofustis glycolicus DSM 9705]
MMNKYDQLWKHIAKENKQTLVLSFDEIKAINGIAIDHSFLNYKKELINYGFSVEQISIKNKTVEFHKVINLV